MWTLENIKKQLEITYKKGFIGKDETLVEYRHDDGAIGQILEKEFNVKENNLTVADLGEFELKGMRRNSNTLTLCHKRTENGLSPIGVFDRFGYVRRSLRNPNVLKKKFFATITGKKQNNHGLRLMSNKQNRITMTYKETEFICDWNLEDSLQKINSIILVFADTIGVTNSAEEKFHYKEGYLLKNLKDLSTLVNYGNVVIDFCIDKPLDEKKAPHDRGPHIRIPKRKLFESYESVQLIYKPG